MLIGIDNLLEMSLRLIKPIPIIEAERQITSQNFHNRTNFYIVTRRKPQRIYVFRILYAVDFHSLTRK